ncbi:hypothetical protein [Pseudomonas kulmbachensis]|uniref:hypothetical protein n=1 Tax=Pseudomonas kulmbachensis TaxID=3043408 RepID=UPI002AB060BE|nr:hypothetical protein [Pseudomonas sp. V3/3/4/13]
MANNTGNPIGSTAAKDLSDNAENLDKFANGEEYEYDDRLGRPRKSLKWIEDAALAIPAIDAALRSEQQAARSESEAQISIVAKLEAEAARDTFNLNIGRKADIAEGLRDTVSGQSFTVLAPSDNDYIIEYKNNAGAALEMKRYPSANAIESTRLTSGDIFSSIATFGQVFNGGVLVVGSDGRNIGVKIPAGQTGNTSYVRAELGLQDRISELVGTKIAVDVYYDATLNFVANTEMTTLVMQVIRAGSVATVYPETHSLTQAGAVIHKSLTYTIQAGDIDVCPVFRPGISTTATDRQAVISSVFWKAVSQPKGNETLSDFQLRGRLDPLAKQIAANTPTSGQRMDGNLYAWNGEALGGSARINDASGNFIGLSIPSGASGSTAYVSPFFAIDGVKLAGTTIRVTAMFNATANFTADCPPGNTVAQVKRGAGSVNVAVANLRVSQEGSVITKTFDYVITAADIAIAPTYQIGGAAVAAAYLRSITIASMKFTLANLPAGRVPADELIAIQINAAVSKIPVRGPERYITVAEFGGDFATLAAANAAVASASLTNPVTIIMNRDEDTFNVILNDYVSLVGGGVKRAKIHHRAPDDTDPVLLPGIQILYVNKNHRIENVWVVIENGRYSIHCETGGAFRDGLIEIINCVLEHRGNKGAQAYQDSLPDGVKVWDSLHAWGYGASSGQHIIMRRTKLISPTSAFYVHTNINFSKPVVIELDEVEYVTTQEGGKALWIQPLGSGQADSLTMRGASAIGDLYYWPNPWLPNTLDYQPADHTEMSVTGVDTSPMVFESFEFGRALKIQSVTDGLDSKVAVSGDAVPVIFGKESYSLDGCPGIPGYAYGWADISGEKVGSPSVGNITSLGKRLGNCTTVNKTLNVLIDGVTTRTIVFNQDYTNQDNAAILAAINAVLGSLASATAYNIGGRYRPLIIGEEGKAKNNDLSGIRMGMATVYDASIRNIRKMTATDDPSMFAGITLQDFYPDEIGRIKTSGYIKHTDLYGITTALTFGQRLYVDPAEPGKLTTVAGANPIMRAVRTDAVEVAKK